MKNQNNMISLKVICIKTFTINDITFTENSKYHLIQYINANNFNFFIYNEKIKTQAYPLYPLNIKYKENFMTEKEYRKLKLEKITQNGNK